MLLNEGFKFGTSPILYSWVRSPCLSMVWYRPDARGDVRMLLTFLTGHEFLLPLQYPQHRLRPLARAPDRPRPSYSALQNTGDGPYAQC
jgi:hypothetical protein